MKRFELYEYDKETERLNEEEILDEGLRDVFSAITRRVWKSISTTIGKLKFGQTARIPLITANSNLTEALLLEFGWSGNHYGKYAEMVAAYELLLRLDKEGFRVYKSDIKTAKKVMDDKKKQMSEDITAAKSTGRAKQRDKSKLAGKISQRK